MELPHGRRLRFTTGSWLTPLKRSLQRARDAQGAPLPEDSARWETVMTAHGRPLVNGGGIFPDLQIQEDTLLLPEQELVRVANETQFPLNLRVMEFGFRAMNARRAAEEPPGVTDAEFETFMTSLVDAGLPANLASDPAVRNYLRWRSRIAVAQRMDDVGAEANVIAERDPVLAEAIRLLMANDTQAELFTAIDPTTRQAQASVPRN
jgi:hypothetical protein